MIIALPETLLKIFLSTILLTSLVPSIISYKYSRLSSLLVLAPITACLIESLSITYFYIYSGTASWKLASLNIINIEFTLDPLSLIFINLLTGLWLITTLYTILYMEKIKEKNQSKSLTYMGLTIFAAIFIALSKNLFSMFIGYGLMILFTIQLLLANQTNKKKISNYTKYMIFTSIGLFLPFVVYVAYFTHGVEFKLGGIISNNIPLYYVHIMLMAAIFGIAIIGIFPLHMWLKVTSSTSYPINAIIYTIAITKTGLYCIIKIVIYIFGINYLKLLLSSYNWPIAIGALTILYSSYKVVTETRIKEALVFSTISNAGLILIVIFLLTPQAVEAAICHMVAHGLTKVVLFLAAGRFFSETKATKISELKGLAYKYPVAAIFFFIASMSMFGIPTLACSKSLSLIWQSLAISQYNYILLTILILYIMSTIFYLGKTIYFLFMPIKKIVKVPPRKAIDIAIGSATIPIAAFPIAEKLMDSLLWSIL